MSKSKINVGKLIRRLSPYNIKKGVLYLKHYGLKDFCIKLSERFETVETDYGKWYEKHKLSKSVLEHQRKEVFQKPVKFSIVVPLFQTPEKYLQEMIGSVVNQTYGNWELCLADGSEDGGVTEQLVEKFAQGESRIRYKRLVGNLGISENTNKALQMAEGDYVCLFDHDDLLEESALYEIAKAIVEKGKADIIYTDEDKVTENLSEHFQPHFKPDFSPDLLCSCNYICHFLVIRKSLLDRVGGMRSQFDGAQDYDFILRCTEVAGQIMHVPKVLYHWRIHKASTADNPLSKQYAFEAGKRAIEEHLKRIGKSAVVSPTNNLGFYRTTYRVEEEALISIIIPNKDEAATLKNCIDSIQEISTYRNFEIIIVENNSQKPETFQYYDSLEEEAQIQVVTWEKGFNYSAINNFGAGFAKGEYLLFLNNDMTVITPEWIEELLGNCQRDEVGITGARLFYPDDTMQHGGIVLGIGGIAASVFVGLKRGYTGYMHKAAIQQNLSAVTAACMMVRKRVFDEVQGFEEKLAVAFNDVDFCLRVRELGLLVVYNPFVELYHYESKSRGAEDTKEKVKRFQNEIEFMRSRWIILLKQGDPYYNPNLSLTKWNYELRND